MLNRGKSAPKQMSNVAGKYDMDDLLMQMSYDEHEGEDDEEEEDDEEMDSDDLILQQQYL
jgi:hypothetical protein